MIWISGIMVLIQNCFTIVQDVCMPVMNGLEATRLIRSFEETGNWDEAVKAGVEQSVLRSDSFTSMPPTKRVPIIAVCF